MAKTSKIVRVDTGIGDYIYLLNMPAAAEVDGRPVLVERRSAPSATIAPGSLTSAAAAWANDLSRIEEEPAVQTTTFEWLPFGPITIRGLDI